MRLGRSLNMAWGLVAHHPYFYKAARIEVENDERTLRDVEHVMVE